MADPMNALVSFQAGLDEGGDEDLRPGTIHPDLLVFPDYPNGRLRLTYAAVSAGTVESIAMFVDEAPIDGIPCFQLGCAVIESLRGQGVAKRLVAQAIEELRKYLIGTGMQRFYVEAVVAVSNLPSNKLARRLLSETPVRESEGISGEPTLRYLRLIDVG